MLKKDIEVGRILYWNTTGANNSKISLKCEVIDVGKIWIWVHVCGCLAYNNLAINDLSIKPLHRVTNNNLKQRSK
mgnify:FL=1|jgi:hypothetical protein